MPPDTELQPLLLDSLDCGVVVLDTTGRITFWNQAAERLTGIAATEAVGRLCAEMRFASCFRELAWESGTCRLFREGKISNLECEIERPDGSRVRVLKSGRLLHDEQGRLLGAVENFTDISSLQISGWPARPVGRSGPEDETAPVPGIIGSGAAMRQVFRLVRFAAGSESTVLVTGESGTGKELVAQAIHALSARRERPLVAVNCAALPETLLESELFGHVRGAFSGAIANKVGRFELAAGGTIFLDEIGDISPLIQLKLLRVLQNQEYQRVGESATRRAAVRIIAATNRDLLKLVRSGEFREDLFFRLKVFPIRTPALREHKEDLPELVEHFIRLFNRRTGKGISFIAPAAMKLLLGYCWPGNVRELEHAIEYAFVLGKGPEISPFELPQEILRVEFRRQFCPPGEHDGGLAGLPAEPAPATLLRTPRSGVSREELLRVLEQSGWNQTLAGRLLGVSRVTIWSWMKKLGIRKPEPDRPA